MASRTVLDPAPDATSGPDPASGGPPSEVPTASVTETAGVVAEVLLPLVARGVIRRRPRVVAGLERVDADRRAVDRLRTLRDRYGPGPLRLRLPGRELAIVLDPEDVHRILDGDPEPFAPANLEKRAALAHFQPHGVLVSHGEDRHERRRFNEVVLDSDQPRHQLAERFVTVAHEEADALLELAARFGELEWDDFLPAWYRLVRRVVFGDGARDDHRLTDDLAELRDRANNAYLLPKDRATRRRFQRRLAAHLARAEEGSLAATIAATPGGERTDPTDQVPQWLFAFEPAGMALFRALALVATHPERAAAHLDGDGDDRAAGSRGIILESLRLWPTTPAILRDTTEPTEWRGRTVEPGTAMLIYASLFHRDEDRLPGADEFRPGRWDGRPVDPRTDPPLVPFSAGPGVCPGRNLVLLTTTAMLERLLAEHRPVMADPSRLPAGGPLPSVLDNFSLRIALPRR